jgi:REP-associated tyrosine transposase
LIAAPLTLPIPDLIEKVKPLSTKWIHKTFPDLQGFSWQEGYGAFIVGKSNLQQVIKYIENQEGHHRFVTFEEEFIGFLEANGIRYDKRFVLK